MARTCTRMHSGADDFSCPAICSVRSQRAQVHVNAGRAESATDELLAQPGVEYVHVRDTEAGCYDFRVERIPGSGTCASD